MSRVKFGDVVKDCKEKIDRNNNPYDFYVAGDHMDTEDLVIRRKGQFATDDVGPAFIRLFRPGQVLYGSRRTYLKKVAVADFEGVTANTTFVLETKNEEVLRQRLLPFIMLSESFTEWSIKRSKGSTNPYVLFSDLADFEFDLPCVELQDKYVELLWSLWAVKEAYRNLLAATDELVKARFVEMFGDLGSNTKGWGITTLGKCCELNPKKPKEIADELLVSFVPMENVSEDGNINVTCNKPYSEVKKGYRYFAENDVLFAKITPCMENGKGGIAQRLSNGIGMGSTEFHILRPLKNISNPYWLFYITAFDQFRKQARKVMTGTGGQLRVPESFLEGYCIALPPYELQCEFEQFVSQSKKANICLKESILSAEAMLKSYLETIMS